MASILSPSSTSGQPASAADTKAKGTALLAADESKGRDGRRRRFLSAATTLNAVCRVMASYVDACRGGRGVNE